MSSFRPLADLENHWPACDGGVWTRRSFAPTWKSAVTSGVQREMLSRAIESEILPRLLLAHQSQDPQSSETQPDDRRPDSREVLEFTALLVSHEPVVAQSFVAALRARGMPLEVVFLHLFAPAARLLGVLWDEDICDFTDVSIALSRLQQLLRELAPGFEGAVETCPGAPRAFLATAPGDQHTFGLFVVQEFYRRAGWHVSGGFFKTEKELTAAARAESYDVVGLSVSCDACLKELTSVIRSVREGATKPSMRVLVGGRFFLEHPTFVEKVGADAMAPDGRRAVLKLSSLLDTIPMRY
jgi:MerR family transcriptional regulator, light-induced transcriptional regulator